MSLTISSYSREQLIDLLRIMKDYKTGLLQIGNRAYLKNSKGPNPIRVRVEYPKHSNLDTIQSFSKYTLKTHFGIDSIPENIVFVETPALIGGIRIFAGDDMVDVSFQRFASQVKI